jgi:hypothetical protein
MKAKRQKKKKRKVRGKNKFVSKCGTSSGSHQTLHCGFDFQSRGYPEV